MIKKKVEPKAVEAAQTEPQAPEEPQKPAIENPQNLIEENKQLRNLLIQKDLSLAVWEIKSSCDLISKEIRNLTKVLALAHDIDLEENKEQ